MRRFLPALLAAVLLCGCAPSEQPAETITVEAAMIETTAEPIETTAPPETLPPDPVMELLEAMTTEEKVGQILLARCPGADAAKTAEAYSLGGYVLFGADVQGQTAESLTQTIRTYQSSVRIPMLIAVDEEGGTVCRISASSAFRETPFASPREYYAAGGMDAVLEAETEKAEMLRGLGINVTLGPVCDISRTPGAFMYSRSLGEGPEETAAFIAETVQLSGERGIGSVLKHFPGYGDNADTHIGYARDDRSLEMLEGTDLVPFTAGIHAGCGAVMMSHTVVAALDDTLPVSLSPAAHQYLREQMGFDGVIVTDDLDMDAITDSFGPEEAAVQAVLSGNSLLCVSDIDAAYRGILEAVTSGRITEGQLESAVYRVLKWKMSLGLI